MSNEALIAYLKVLFAFAWRYSLPGIICYPTRNDTLAVLVPTSLEADD